MTGIELLQGIKDGKFKKGDRFVINDRDASTIVIGTMSTVRNEVTGINISTHTLINCTFEFVDPPLEPLDRGTLKMDELIEVSHNGIYWTLGRFACFLNKKVYCFPEGKNSETNGYNGLLCWNYVRKLKEV